MVFATDGLENLSNCCATSCRHIFTRIFLCFVAGLMISGCTVQKPYAQNPFNPFNPYAKLPKSESQKSGSVSSSPAFRAAGLGLAAASRPIPGALPHGADIGIAAVLFLGSGSSRPPNEPINKNFIITNMPFSMANDEDDAKVKFGAIVEKAIALALHPEYRVKIDEYDDTYAFGRVMRPRWLKVDGPFCENWSCQVIAPIPTANALQWEGEIVRGKEGWRYHRAFEQSIGFVKISQEFDKDGFIASRRHWVEGYELADFDYADFLRRVSANLPDWVTIRFFPAGQSSYDIRQGVVLTTNESTSTSGKN